MTAFDQLTSSKVTAAAFSYDGSMLAFGNMQGMLHIWQSEGLCERLKHQFKLNAIPVLKEITSVAITPPSTQAGSTSVQCTVAATCDDGKCYISRCQFAERTTSQHVGIPTSEADTCVLAKPTSMKTGSFKHCRCGTLTLVSTLISCIYGLLHLSK